MRGEFFNVQSNRGEYSSVIGGGEESKVFQRKSKKSEKEEKGKIKKRTEEKGKNERGEGK